MSKVSLKITVTVLYFVVTLSIPTPMTSPVPVLTIKEMEDEYLGQQAMDIWYEEQAKVVFQAEKMARGAPEQKVLHDEYLRFRFLSLLNFYLYIVDNHVDRTSKDMKLILADEFLLDFNGLKITSMKDFNGWFYGKAAEAPICSHRYKNLKIASLNDGSGEYMLAFDLLWNGIVEDTGVHMIGKTNCTWTVLEGDPMHGKAKIKTMLVRSIVDFQAVENSNVLQKKDSKPLQTENEISAIPILSGRTVISPQTRCRSPRARA
mmetsp:Transcript_13407/g.32875  ORF Transcript_13407/g.32875 Transcript_13407/m.32875 type:complete len:262 (+) Transcript_13407:141-926(+)